ncbi:MAG: hypothetical protein ACK56I_07990, partial [bacterium]
RDLHRHRRRLRHGNVVHSQRAAVHDERFTDVQLADVVRAAAQRDGDVGSRAVEDDGVVLPGGRAGAGGTGEPGGRQGLRADRRELARRTDRCGDALPAVPVGKRAPVAAGV